jgi:hypothetical protein
MDAASADAETPLEEATAASAIMHTAPAASHAARRLRATRAHTVEARLRSNRESVRSDIGIVFR